MDIASCANTGTSCGQRFQIGLGLGSTSPTAGDTSTFNVVCSDGSTGTVTATVSAVLSAFATNLAPTTGTSTSTTPTFSWNDPASASSYTYQFYMNDCNGNTIWQIPGNNSNSNGFASTITSITWNVDPTGSNDLPSVSNLTSGTNYIWQIQVQNNNRNSAVTQVHY